MVSDETKRKISESLKGRIAWNKGKPHSAETRAKISAKAKTRFQNIEYHPFYGRHHSEETKEKIRKSKIGQPGTFMGRHHNEETKAKLKQARLGKPSWNKGLLKSEETKRKLSLALLGRPRSEASRLKQSNTYKAMWQNPEYRERTIKVITQAMHRKPNKPEKQLIELISREALPFRYTGDGSFILGGYIPDFVQCNGRKEIIELFGDYWHSKKKITWHQTELGRQMAYAQFGYKTLIIWEHELQDEQKVINRIKSFARR